MMLKTPASTPAREHQHQPAPASILQGNQHRQPDGHPHELGAGSFSRYKGSAGEGGHRNQDFIGEKRRHKKGPNITVRAYSIPKVLKNYSINSMLLSSLAICIAAILILRISSSLKLHAFPSGVRFDIL